MSKFLISSCIACADAYLSPKISEYVQHFCSGFDSKLLKVCRQYVIRFWFLTIIGWFKQRVRVYFMQSDGGLSPISSFSGFRAVLSGPAGGLVAAAKTAFNEQSRVPVIGFDMGGTSTDVSRFAGWCANISSSFHLKHIFQANSSTYSRIRPLE
jgi:5-oxoprolinase (ATP-hydrolysing)